MYRNFQTFVTPLYYREGCGTLGPEKDKCRLVQSGFWLQKKGRVAPTPIYTISMLPISRLHYMQYLAFIAIQFDFNWNIAVVPVVLYLQTTCCKYQINSSPPSQLLAIDITGGMALSQNESKRTPGKEMLWGGRFTGTEFHQAYSTFTGWTWT